MVNLSYDPFQSTGSTSGTANVAYGQSTGSQYQGADIADNLLFPQSGQVVTIFAPLVFASGAGLTSQNTSTTTPASVLQIGGIATSSGIGFSGTNSVGQITVIASGGGGAAGPAAPTGSGGTVIAGASGAFTPAGFFFIQVPTSGNPVVKVPFFNS